MAFNRTIVELKLPIESISGMGNEAFNRTIVELKFANEVQKMFRQHF